MDKTGAVVTAAESRYQTIVTDTGKRKILAASMSADKVRCATAVVGDGGGSYYIPTPDMVAVKREVWRGPVAAAEINRKSPNMVDIKIVLPGKVGGFTVRECAIEDDDGDIIAICNIPDTEKAIIEDGVAAALTILMHIVVTDAGALEFLVDPTIDTATATSIPMVIPTKGWTKSGPEGYPWRVDVENGIVTALHIPFVTLTPESIQEARECDLCPAAETVSGAVRLWAKKVPSKELAATVLLVTQGGNGAGGSAGGGEYILSPATAFKLGGIKVGNGLNVTQDGTLSVNPEKVMTAEDLVDEAKVKQDVAAILNEGEAK